MDNDLIEAANELLTICREKGDLKIATAESCTGGLIAAALTAIPGSSAWFDRGFVTYSNDAKTELLEVPQAMIAEKGAVSEEVARAMALGALRRSKAGCAVSVTGIAGPDGGSPEKPVGLVHLAATRFDGALRHERRVFAGNRHDIRKQTVLAALDLLGRLIEERP